eukprot:g2562.t1
MKQVFAEPPRRGPYETGWKKYRVDVFDSSDPHVFVFFPKNMTRVPLISYAHGLFGGGEIDIAGYFPLFHQIASYGFVVAAPSSCNVGCTSTAHTRYTACAGTPPPDISTPGWNVYFGEQLRVIDWARNITSLDGGKYTLPFDIDWSAGVGIAGHSMGGIATTTSAHHDCVSEWDIRAAVVHHAAPSNLRNGGGNAGLNVTTIPLAAFTSSGDSCCEKSTREIFEAAPTPIKAYRDLKGSSHLEPVLIPPIENRFLATYTASFFKIYLGKRETPGMLHYELIYGNGTDSLCKYQESVECEVVLG